jgi:hypothetical protein
MDRRYPGIDGHERAEPLPECFVARRLHFPGSMPRSRLVIGALAVTASLATGCYHFTFEERPRAPSDATVVHEVRRPTYLNGFVGNGRVDTSRFCEDPVRTELRVTATDVVVSVGTLLIYTPHTLYVTCPATPGIARR